MSTKDLQMHKNRIATKNKSETPSHKPRESADSRSRRLLFLEPFFGGSHRDFAVGLVENSRHRIDLMTLPGRFWKWRMRGAALRWAAELRNLEVYHGLIATDMMSLAELKGVTTRPLPPALLYFHENQLTYPLAPGESLDAHYGFTNIASALAADRVCFNSAYQMERFFEQLPGFLKMMPDHRPMWVIDEIRSKSSVLHPGCRFPMKRPLTADGETPRKAQPLIIWNHRWEFDKNPEVFFKTLYRLEKRGFPFQVALLGEQYRDAPGCFAEARDRLKHRVVQYGFVKDRSGYLKWLSRGDIVISTAAQENFGIAIVEAIRYGCVPLLPDRLAYPEVLPERYHQDLLYRSETELIERLTTIIQQLDYWRLKTEGLKAEMGRFAWEARIAEFDLLLDELAES